MLTKIVRTNFPEIYKLHFTTELSSRYKLTSKAKRSLFFLKHKSLHPYVQTTINKMYTLNVYIKK